MADLYFANTHMHSIFSDGVNTPEELIKLGKMAGHSAMLLTDHDTVSGQHRFMKAARKEGILTMMATELSVSCSFGRFHLVCVDFNMENKGMRDLLEYTSAGNTRLTEFLVEEGLQNGTLRKGIVWQEVLDKYSEMDCIFNSHVFRYAVEKGIYNKDEYPEFYKSTFGIPKPRKLQLQKQIGYPLPPAEEVIEIVLKADGVPIIAHPTENGNYFFKEEADKYIKLGVKGFEIRHPSMNPDECEFYNGLCDEHNLYKLGGTDHHGDKKTDYPLTYPLSSGYVNEKQFMQLYKRELG